MLSVCGQRQGAEKRDPVFFYLTRGRGNIYPTDDYIIEHVMLANILDVEGQTPLVQAAQMPMLPARSRRKVRCSSNRFVYARLVAPLIVSARPSSVH